MMGDILEVTSWPLQKNVFYKITTSALCVEIKAQTAVIFLSKKPKEDSNVYKIVLGPLESYIQTDGALNLTAQSRIQSPEILSRNEYRGLWVTWYGANLRVGLMGQGEPLMTHPLRRDESLDLQYFGLPCLQNMGMDEPVRWRFAFSPVNISPKPIKPVKGGKAKWVAVDDQLPDDALIGGYYKTRQENLYIIRAEHRGSITPGKFVPSEGIGYIPWGGTANEKENFEVLCGFNVQWVPTSSSRIPAGAIVGGKSEIRNEILYVGRAYHEGHLIPGKVQPSHQVCYIPFGFKEIAKREYEILVDPEVALRDASIVAGN